MILEDEVSSVIAAGASFCDDAALSEGDMEELC